MTTRETILERMRSHRYHPMRLRGLARFFDIAEEDYPRFRALIKEMIRDGELAMVRGKLRPAAPERRRRRGRARLVEGRFSLSSRGFGFVEPTDPDGPTGTEDLFIPPDHTLDAVTGDLVVAEVLGRGRRGYWGRVVEVKERGQQRFVGTLLETEAGYVVRPDGGVLPRDFLVPDATASGARPKDKVVFEVLRYGLRDEPGEAVITEVLGHRGDPGVDTLAVIRQFDLPDEFSDAALAEARRAAERLDEEAVRGRRDLTDLLVITIDPEDARDFDDAISLAEHPDGSVTLGVHIADVAHFVPVGSRLDAEAYERGTSVYLPTTVLPMLPEVLSGAACSLQEGRRRLTKSVFITYGPDGEPGEVDLCRSVIRSTKRLTYRQAQAVLDGKADGEVPPEVADLLRRMDRLARRLLERRRRLGYLELDLPEVDLEFDDRGRVVAAHPEDTSFSHRIIEMFMVEANEAVARELDRAGLPCVRRIHPPPDDEAADELRHYARSVGHRLTDPTDRRALQALLNKVRGKPEAYGIHLAVLRSLQKAEYSLKPEGHFALGSEAYCHFTSPIRRYPDLMVHRAVDVLLEARRREGGRRGARRRAKARADRRRDEDLRLAPVPLDEAAAHCSRTERRAEAAERELTKIKLLEYLRSRIGRTFTGVITGVQAFGVFVEDPELLIDGLVHIDSLTDDRYRFDRRRWALVGRDTGKVLRVGSTLEVRIASVDIPARQLTLVPVPAERRRRAGRGAKTAARKAEPAPTAAGKAGASASSEKTAEAPKSAAAKGGKAQGAGKARRKAAKKKRKATKKKKKKTGRAASKGGTGRRGRRR